MADYAEYRAKKTEFFKKHDSDFDCWTSPMDQYSRYHKVYSFADGAQWCELMSLEHETVETEAYVHGCKFTFKNTVDLQRIEFWSTEFGSDYYYERY